MSYVNSHRLPLYAAIAFVTILATAPLSEADPCAPQSPTTYPVGDTEVTEFEVCDRGTRI